MQSIMHNHKVESNLINRNNLQNTKQEIYIWWWFGVSETRTCKYCGETGLTWDYEHHKNTGKWRLIKHKGCSDGTKLYGKDRCAACRWNCNKVCDLSISKYKHQAKI